MSKKGLKFGIASAAVIGAGAAVLRAKNKSEAKKAAETTFFSAENLRFLSIVEKIVALKYT